MKPTLAIAALALAGTAGIAAAQSLDPREPSTHELDGPPAREVYIAQGPTGPIYIDEYEIQALRREARQACGDRSDSMLDLVSWKLYRRCVFVETRGLGAASPFYPYERYPR